MANGEASPPLFKLALRELVDVNAGVQLLTQLLGVKGRQGLKYSPTLVPAIDSLELILQPASEILIDTINITAAAGNVAGSVYVMRTVPDGEMWRLLDSAFSSQVLAADQTLAGIFTYWSDRAPVAGAPAGLLGALARLAVSPSQFGAVSLIVGGVYPWLRPGSTIGFVLQAPAVLGVAAAITINLRSRIARLKY